MSTLEADIKEGELAKEFKEKYADIFDSSNNINFNDPKSISELKNKLRPMILAVHSDKGQGLSKDFEQSVAAVFENLKRKNAAGVKSALSELGSFLDKKAGSLTRNKSELNSLKQQFGL